MMAGESATRCAIVDERPKGNHNKTHILRREASPPVARNSAPHRKAIAQENEVDRPNATDRTDVVHIPMYMTGNRPYRSAKRPQK